VDRAVVAAELGIKAHARMLSHACGYKNVAVAEFRRHLPRTRLEVAAGASGQSDLHHRKGHFPPNEAVGDRSRKSLQLTG
jgi:hypothetical protein